MTHKVKWERNPDREINYTIFQVLALNKTRELQEVNIDRQQEEAVEQAGQLYSFETHGSGMVATTSTASSVRQKPKKRQNKTKQNQNI